MNEQDNIIRIAFRYFDLVGEGTEYVVDKDNNILAKFYNGKLTTEIPRGNTEDTVTAA